MLRILLISVLVVNIAVAIPSQKRDGEEEATTPEAAITPPATEGPTVVTEEPTTTPKTKRVITFDQRQEGHYNIRADLENIMIVVLSSPPSGLSTASSASGLLDFLMRNNKIQQQTNRKFSKKQNQQPYKAPEVVVFDASQPQSQARVADEFIEGRTPYKVDISSSARSDSQPSVLRLIKPFAFNIETPKRIVFPSSGNYFYSPSATNLRDTRSLSQRAEEVRTNTVATNTNPSSNTFGDGDNEEEFQFIDLPNNSFDRLDYAHSDVDMLKLQLQEDNGGDDWELKLIGAREQCGPDRRRDSYGVCQFYKL